MSLLRGVHSMEIQGEDGFIQLLPLGNYTGRDGRGPYQVRDPEQIIQMSKAVAGRMDLVIDYDHQGETAKDKSGPVPAAGWIKDLEVREDGIYGKVEWTQAAQELLNNKEYRYISPVFYHDKQGVVKRIVGAGLTNTPNLETKAVASQQGTQSMELNKLLAKMFGLPEDATDEQITAHAQQLVDDDKAVKATQSEIGKLVGAEEDGDLVKAVQSALDQKSTDSVDLSKYVPIASFKALQSQVADLSGKLDGQGLDAKLAQAQKDGKLLPHMVDWAKSLHAQNPQALDDFLETAPVMAPIKKDTVSEGEPGKKTGLTDDEKAVAHQLGMTEEQMLKSKGVEE